jgi:PadR family transcriptional regulator, regulatory protein AphA
MNTLASGLLGLLVWGPQSGYDLLLRMKAYWPVSHSQIYPLLAKHEQNGLVTCTVVHQADRPDKKLYSLTEAGLAVVEEWLVTPTPEPVLRDEIVLKAYCLGPVVPPERARALFAQREARYAARAVEVEERLEALRQECGGSLTDVHSFAFAKWVVLQQALAQNRQGESWCKWVLGLLSSPPGTNFLAVAPG